MSRSRQEQTELAKPATSSRRHDSPIDLRVTVFPAEETDPFVAALAMYAESLIESESQAAGKA